MADANPTPALGKTAAGSPRKRAAFTRTERPVFAVISYQDEDGNPVKLSKSRLVVKVEKDMEKLVALLEDTDGYSVVAKLDMPKATSTRSLASNEPA